MGQKVNPHGFRLGTLYTWKSQWYAKGNDYQKFLLEDIKLRKFLLEKLHLAGIVRVEIKRSINTIKVILYVSRPGVVIGRGGSGLEALKKMIKDKLRVTLSDSKSVNKIDLEVKEVKNPDLAARLVALRIVDQLAKRYPHRRAVSMAMDRVMNSGAEGVKIVLAGRVAGAEISRTERYSRGSIPLQTLRADIDYSQMPSLTKSGYIGVKVWIYKKEEEIK
ncbi:30S ribosomal protein S3 [Candidatus Beckwithbacteria bacterium CG10_big_fil_rev_8_21_14_0_10_34_10]|uniref:Small ribosomal subunit protein uS3 n=1 Tax=Candidatus Beckwithbacteria bacterium CG10_big_fil_rev_8_21_14_0_10_34_10 TaxID=1974495 RepID=A0A2H0W7S5_9BACT|nr:MAG: 30S ribosomal protein S3 [Candidatus Beckwithbacteria bacterium CG10_big_fil_rev_8_21_14_0_10_34_10]